MRRTLFFLYVILTSIFLISIVSAATPYTIGMIGGNGSENIASRLLNGKANVMFIGDSKSIQDGGSRPQYGAYLTWRPKVWKGVATPWVASQGSGFAVNTEQYANNRTSITMGGHYGDNSSGWNIMDAVVYNITSDLTNFGQFANFEIEQGFYGNWTNSSGVASKWFNGTSLKFRFFYVPDPNSTYLGISPFLANGSLDFSGTYPTYFNDSGVRTIKFQDFNIAASNGSSAIGINIGTRDANESSPNKSRFYPIGARLWNPNIVNGLEFQMSSASSNWQTECHLEGSYCQSINAQDYVSNYSTESIVQMINGSDTNTFVIYIGNIGNNYVGDEVTADNHPINGSFQNHTELIIERYAKAYYKAKPQAGINSTDRPYFILMPDNERSNGDEFRLEQEKELENLTRYQHTYPALENVTVGMYRQRAKINDTIGAFSVVNSSGFFQDSLHQSFTGVAMQMGLMWNTTMGAITPVNGSISTFNFTLNSDTILNSTPTTNQGLFNNTDIYPQSVNLTGLTNALVYAPAYQYIDTNGNNLAMLASAFYTNVSNMTGSLNVSVSPSQNVFVLNYYNITQGQTITNDPLVLMSANSSTIVITSPSLTNSVQVPVIMQLNSSWGTQCSNVAMMNYTTDSGTKYGWQGQAAINACNNLTTTGLSLVIDPSVASNTLTFTLSSSTNTATTAICPAFTASGNGLTTFFSTVIIVFGILALVIIVGVLLVVANSVSGERTFNINQDGLGDFMKMINLQVFFWSILSITILAFVILVVFGTLCS